MRLTTIASLSTLLFVLLIASSCQPEKERMFKKSSLLMDTLVNITVVANSGEEAETAIDAAFDEIRQLEELLSFWTEDSEVALINRNAGKQPVKVSPETMDIIEASIHISEKTGGAFDATIGPVIRLWDFKNKKLPDKKAVENALGLVNYRMLKLDNENGTVFLTDMKMSYDTGGIAKGYAADRAVEILKDEGIQSGLVAVAGDIRAFGRKPGGEKWSVGIRNPRAKGEEDDLIAIVELENEAISTSGDYERFFILNGNRYHHLLDPDTGYPAEGCISVSVIAGKAVHTDGFSTGVFVMGPERGLALLNDMGFEGIIIDKDGKAHVTEGIRSRLHWNTRRN